MPLAARPGPPPMGRRDAVGAPPCPPALQEFLLGGAADTQGRRYALIDAPALLEAWAAELTLA